jgi:HAMP domain-containing protein
VGGGELAIFIPIVAIVVGGLIAITTMLTNHQRKMAEILRKDVQTPDLAHEVRAMRQEMAELKDRVNQQALSLEDRVRTPQRLEEQ